MRIGNDNKLYLKESNIFKLIIDFIPLVIPHKGHGIWNTYLNIQNGL